jgi:hypothetical protein
MHSFFMERLLGKESVSVLPASFAAVVVGLFTYYAGQESAPLRFALDDAYLYHAFAANSSLGAFFKYSVFDVGSNGCTSLLYYLLLTVLYGVVRLVTGDWHSHFVPVAITVTFVLHVVTYVVFAFLVARAVSRAATEPFMQFAMTVFILFNGSLYYIFFSGIEGPLSLLLAFFAFEYLRTARLGRLAAVLFLMGLHRPDFAFGAVLFAIVLFVVYRPAPLGLRIGLVLAPLAGLAIVFAANLVATGSPLPNSLARTAVQGVDLETSHSLGSFLLSQLSPSQIARRLLVVLTLINPAITPYTGFWATGTAAQGMFNWVGLHIAIMTLLSVPYLLYCLATLRHALWPIDRGRLALIALPICLVSLFLAIGGRGEFARYILPSFVLWTLAILELARQRPPTQGIAAGGPRWLPSTIVALMALGSLGPAMEDVGNTSRFVRQVHFAIADSVARMAEAAPRRLSLGTWETGVINMRLSGIVHVVDLYGLGTARYRSLPFPPAPDRAELFFKERIDLVAQYVDESGLDNYQETFLDQLRQKGAKVTAVETVRAPANRFIIHPLYPHSMTLYRVEYP